MLARTQKSLLRFILIGGLTFGIDYSLTLFLHYIVGLPGFLASAASFSCAFLFNFLMSAKWVFKQRRARRFTTKSQVTLFLFLTMCNLGISTGFVAVASSYGIEVVVSKVVVTTAIAAWNFFINQNFIFAEKS